MLIIIITVYKINNYVWNYQIHSEAYVCLCDDCCVIVVVSNGYGNLE